MKSPLHVELNWRKSVPPEKRFSLGKSAPATLNALLSGALFLAAAAVALAAPNNWTDETPEITPFRLNPDNRNTIMVYDAELSGNVRSFPGMGMPLTPEKKKRENWTKYAPGALWVEVWKTPDDKVIWTVNAPKAATYQIYIVASGRDSELEVSDGKSAASAAVTNMWDITFDTGHYPPQKKFAKWGKDLKPPDDYSKFVWFGWDRIPIGKIKIPAGKSQVTVRSRKPVPDLAVACIELVRPEAEALLKKKAQKLRSDTKWMSDAKYGVFFHWTSSASTSKEDGWKATWPRHGERKVFPANVDAFDVDKFVEMVRETGAEFVTLTATWSELSFPAPIKALETMFPGHTSKRDLVMELADALGKHNIKLILYYHALGYPDWYQMMQNGTFADHWCAITEEVGNRYGKKLAGWWFDVGGVYWFNSLPFDRLCQSAKAGFPGRVIAYNNASFWPKVTDFQDYFTGEGPQFLVDESQLRYVPKDGNGIFSGGRHAGLQASLCFTLDTEWIHGVKDREIPKPTWSKELLIQQVQEAIERKQVPFIGFALYEDGTPNPKTLDLMRALKTAIRGE